MFFSQKTKKLPHFCEYLVQKERAVSREGGAFWALAGCLFAPISLAGMAFILAQFLNPFLAVSLAFFVGLPSLFTGLAIFDRWRRKRQRPDQIRLAQVREVVAAYWGPMQKKKLHRDLDTVAGELLDACAFQWQRTMAALNSPGWQTSGIHRQNLREQARIAADSAMEDIMMLCTPCLSDRAGKPRDWHEKVEDFIDLDVIDTLQQMSGVKVKMNKGYRSPYFGAIAEPVRRTAHQLRELAEEAERMAQEANDLGRAGNAGVSLALESVLADIRAVREAENELEQHQGV